jgi:long-chain acyl-CoA synthetase
MELHDPTRFDLSTVRFAVSGGSGLEPSVIDRFRQRFGVEIWEGYGLTEASSAVSTTRVADQRPGSIGKVLPGQELRIVDDSGADVLRGDPGEIWLRGPGVFKSYWNDEAATSAAFSGDWFMTGDVAYQDEGGYLWLVDPESDVIEISGFKVYPKEVEEALVEHPAVVEAAAVGERDPKQGHRVKAFVVLEENALVSEGELIVHCTKRLARFKVPAEIQFTSELPRLESGVVVKRILRRRSGD